MADCKTQAWMDAQYYRVNGSRFVYEQSVSNGKLIDEIIDFTGKRWTPLDLIDMGMRVESPRVRRKIGRMA